MLSQITEFIRKVFYKEEERLVTFLQKKKWFFVIILFLGFLVFLNWKWPEYFLKVASSSPHWVGFLALLWTAIITVLIFKKKVPAAKRQEVEISNAGFKRANSINGPVAHVMNSDGDQRFQYQVNYPANTDLLVNTRLITLEIRCINCLLLLEQRTKYYSMNREYVYFICPSCNVEIEKSQELSLRAKTKSAFLKLIRK